MKKINKTIISFIKFGLVGFTNTVVSYVINISVLFICRPFDLSFDYVIANIVAFILSVLWSFFLNNRFVFKTEQNGKKNIFARLIKTYIAYGFTGLILNNIISYILIDRLLISKYIAPIICLVISVPVNFILMKFWAFSEKKSNE